MADVTVAVGMMVKNEAHSIQEWIAHYMALGFDDIVIYDNASTDGTSAICSKLASAGVLQYVLWPDMPTFDDLNMQVLAYRDMQHRIKTDWVCFCDSDEFLVLENGGRVQDLIRVAGLSGMPIALSWKIFGSSGEKERRSGLVTERFRHCAGISFHANDHIKTLGPVKLLKDGAGSHIHGWILKEVDQFYVNALGDRVEIEGHTFLRPPCWTGAWINHYIVKSVEEFELKRRRGRGDRPDGNIEKYCHTYENYFVPYDRNELVDKKIDAYRKLTQDRMKILSSILLS